MKNRRRFHNLYSQEVIHLSLFVSFIYPHTFKKLCAKSPLVLADVEDGGGGGGGLSFVELQQKYNDQKEVVVYLCIKLSFLSMCD